MELKDRLRELRGNITQTDCANNIGVSPANYTKWEKGVAPTYKVLIQIADYYNVSLDYLTGRTNYKNPEYKELCEDTGLTENALKGLQLIRESSEHNSVDILRALNYLLERELDDEVQAALAEYQLCADKYYMYEYFPDGESKFALSTLLFYIANDLNSKADDDFYDFYRELAHKRSSYLDHSERIKEDYRDSRLIRSIRTLEERFIDEILPNEILPTLRSNYVFDINLFKSLNNTDLNHKK